MTPTRLFKGAFLLLLTLFLNCASFYKINDQESPGASLAAFLINIPPTFSMRGGTLVGPRDKEYEMTYTAEFDDGLRKRYMVFANVVPGEYYMRNLLAQTEPVRYGNYSRWKIINLKFEAPEKGRWKISGAGITYFGRLVFVKEDRLDEFLNRLNAKLTKKIAKERFLRAVLFHTRGWPVKRPQKTLRFVFLRLDHPAIVGEEVSLREEERFLKGVFFWKKSGEIPRWKNLARERLSKIRSRLKELSSKKKSTEEKKNGKN